MFLWAERQRSYLKRTSHFFCQKCHAKLGFPARCTYVLQHLSAPLLLRNVVWGTHRFFLFFILTWGEIFVAWSSNVAEVWAGSFAVLVFLTFLNPRICQGSYNHILPRVSLDLCTLLPDSEHKLGSLKTCYLHKLLIYLSFHFSGIFIDNNVYLYRYLSTTLWQLVDCSQRYFKINFSDETLRVKSWNDRNGLC